MANLNIEILDLSLPDGSKVRNRANQLLQQGLTHCRFPSLAMELGKVIPVQSSSTVLTLVVAEPPGTRNQEMAKIRH